MTEAEFSVMSEGPRTTIPIMSLMDEMSDKGIKMPRKGTKRSSATFLRTSMGQD